MSRRNQMAGHSARWGLELMLLSALPSAITAQDAERRRYQEECDGGNPSACVTLGFLYEAGQGATRDLELAASLYERACDGQDLRGCTNLGLMYESGTGVNRDVDRAVELYRAACEGGETQACDRLSSMEVAGLIAPSGPSATTGQVADAETGTVLGEAIVGVPSLGVQAVSDGSGRFELSDLPPGRHTLRAERLGYEVSESELMVPGTPQVLILLGKAEVGDPRAPGRVVGRVMEDARPLALSDVDVAVQGQDQVRTLSNQQGRFTLRDVDPGLVEIRFERLGYAARTATLIVQPGRTVEVAATMGTQPIELEPIQVTAYSSFLEENGFYQRELRGFGKHFDRQDLEVINPIELSDVIWRVPGVRIQYGAGGEARAVSRRSFSLGQGECVLPIYIDGVRSADSDLHQLPPDWIDAMEVYHGVGTPIQYTGDPDACGVVLLWTRR